MSSRPRLSEAARVAIASSTRLELLLLLEESSWTTSELAVELGVKRATILHHLAALLDEDLVEVVGTVPIAGGPLRSYGATHHGLANAVAGLNAVFSESSRKA